MSNVTNIAAYQFARLSHLKPLRERLTQLCRERELKGTILLSLEGINLFVAGDQQAIEILLTELRSIPGLEKLTPKYSVSAEQPFHRMLVKIKKEIIAFGVEGIDPVGRPAPKISPRELKQWLDEGRPVTLLDTRNRYEVKLGTFNEAVCLNIDHFRSFPESVQQLPPSMKQQPIVMFCTGGIRCEKAGPYMEREGFEKIFQLDGGILKYFEDCGADHYQGECFVFDHRVGVDPALQESESVQCFACQATLTAEEMQDKRYVEGQSCPQCFQLREERRRLARADRQRQLDQFLQVLPGSEPYTNLRPLNVPARFEGHNVIDFLCELFSHVPREEWLATCEAGNFRRRPYSMPARPAADEPTLPVLPAETVRAGDRYFHVLPQTKEPDINPAIRILHEDEAIIVIQKPAPLPMHPCGRFHRNTLQYILGQVYQPQSPRPVHRLDANTSGVVLFARTRHFARLLQAQFEHDGLNRVEKEYLARVIGHPPMDSFTCSVPISQDAGQAGSREVDLENGLSAHTEFTVIQRLPDGTSLLRVVPLTGRTNQIRVHLWHLGFPILGDVTYLPASKLGQRQTIEVDEPPLCLLAHRIRFQHPMTGERVTCSADTPEWGQSHQSC